MENNMPQEKEFQNMAEILKNRLKRPKPPAHEWQDLALRVIQDICPPNFKRPSVFKLCKIHSKERIERALNDTKELCQSGEKWKYFFKVINSEVKKDSSA